MKVFFDTNVYIAEALLGGAAERIVKATHSARWRVLVSEYVLEEIQRVLVEKLGFSPRLAGLTMERARRRATLAQQPLPRHPVPADPADSPILNAALASGTDILVTNDVHLLALNPFQGMRVISMTDYLNLLAYEGLLD